MVVPEKTPESPLDSKEIKSVNPKQNQPWIFIGRTGAEAETPILWPPDKKSWFIGKTLMLGKTEGKKRRVADDEMIGWHHQLNGHEFEQTPGESEGREALWAAVHRVAKSQKPLSDWTTNNNKHYLSGLAGKSDILNMIW